MEEEKFELGDILSEIIEEDIPTVSCFEVSNMLSGKWINAMFEENEGNIIQVSYKSFYSILANSNPKDVADLLHKYLLGISEILKYRKLSSNRVSKSYISLNVNLLILRSKQYILR